MLRALQQGPFDPLQTVELKFLSDSAPACIGLHQEGRGPARIFGRRFVPRVWAGPGNPEAPAWLCAQGSHYSLQGPGGEPASAALGGGRQGVPCPFRLRAHSTRSVASSWALARGASLADNYRAAGWATPNTFSRPNWISYV